MFGCASTSTLESSGVSDSADVATSEYANKQPTTQLTVAAQSLKSWPYDKANLTYSIKKEALGTSVGNEANKEKWQAMTEQSIVNNLNQKGLTYIPEGKSKLTVKYSVTEPNKTQSNSDLVFKANGSTVGSKNGSIDVSIVDNFTRSIIWSGSVTGEADIPLVTDAQKKHVINSLLESLFHKLPVAQ